MKRKFKTNCSIVRLFGLFECGRVVRCAFVVALCAVGLAAFAGSEISAVSAEGFLDLTVGDRIAAVEEPIVVDPAWGNAKTAQVQIDGESSARTYTSVSIDTWNTTALVPGRYMLALTAGTTSETAAFWKTGDGWVVFDSSNITADVTFEVGKTYLMLGTNTVAGGCMLTVADGAKFEYAEGAGFTGGTLEMPKRYRKDTVEGDLFQIVEAVKGCADNPWEVGEGVEAYTNGTELVVGGAGTVADISEIPADVKDGIAAIAVAEPTVGVQADAFQGVGASGGVALTLPDNWQGELPEGGVWYGATGVELTRWPKAVKNVKPRQRYPWNGLVDVTFDLTGEGSVAVAVQVTVDGKKLANPTMVGGTTFDLGSGGELKGLKVTWDAKADFGDETKHEKIKVKLTVSPAEPD